MRAPDGKKIKLHRVKAVCLLLRKKGVIRTNKLDIQHYCQADDLRTGFEELERGGLGRPRELLNRPTRLK